MPGHRVKHDLKAVKTWQPAAEFGAIGITTDLIAEDTAAAGVTIDGVLLKDGAVTASGASTFSAGATVATSQSLVVTTADRLTVGGVIVPQHLELNFIVPPHASITEYSLWVAPAAYQVTAINVTPNLVQGGALTATVCKAVSTTAPIKTTTPMHTADAIDCNATAHTVQPITLTVTIADLQLAAGDRIGIDFSAALTTGSIAVSIRLKRI